MLIKIFLACILCILLAKKLSNRIPLTRCCARFKSFVKRYFRTTKSINTEYMRIRQQELYKNEIRAINDFLRDHILGSRWAWASQDRTKIYVYDSTGRRKTYMVFYTTTGDQHESVFAVKEVLPYQYHVPIKGKLRRQSPLRGCLTNALQPAQYQIQTKSDIDIASRQFAEKLKDQNAQLQAMAYKIASGEKVSVYGADYNENRMPSRKELRALAEEFQKIGFIVNPINFSTGELTLNLADENV